MSGKYVKPKSVRCAAITVLFFHRSGPGFGDGALATKPDNLPGQHLHAEDREVYPLEPWLVGETRGNRKYDSEQRGCK